MNSVKFHIGIPPSRGAGLNAGPWTLNVHRNDIYVSVVDNRGVLKLSIHCEEESFSSRDPWRLAFTSEHVASGRQPIPPGNDRCIFSFAPTQWDSGIRPLVIYGAPRQSLRSGMVPSGSCLIEAVDDWSTMTCAEVWQTEPDCSLPQYLHLIAGPLTLKNGRRVWVTRHTEPLLGGPEIEPDAQIAMPLDPRGGEVGVPFIMIKGLLVPRFAGLSQIYGAPKIHPRMPEVRTPGRP